MSDPIGVVEEFCGQWSGGIDRVRAALDRWFTPSTIWENVGFSITNGPDEAFRVWQGFADLGFGDIRVEMLHLAACGNIVLTERIDHLLASDGSSVFSPRVMGVFEIDGEHISAWRDYTDPAVLAAITARAAGPSAPKLIGSDA